MKNKKLIIIIAAVVVLLIIIFAVVSSARNKRLQAEAERRRQQQLAALQAGGQLPGQPTGSGANAAAIISSAGDLIDSLSGLFSGGGSGGQTEAQMLAECEAIYESQGAEAYNACMIAKGLA